jgi:hypothetical protein
MIHTTKYDRAGVFLIERPAELVAGDVGPSGFPVCPDERDDRSSTNVEKQAFYAQRSDIIPAAELP